MTTRKNNRHRRLQDVNRALLKQHKIGVVSLSSGTQHVINVRTGKPTGVSTLVMDALTKTTHKWYIYVSAFNVMQNGERYTKSIELRMTEYYLTSSLSIYLHDRWLELIDSCNQQHLIGSAWIAIPDENANLTEEQAGAIYDRMGVWE